MPGYGPQDESSRCQQRTDEEIEMNWAPEIVQVEMNYRVERALGDPKTTLEHRRAAAHAHPSWWQRYRAHHAAHHDDGDSRAA
jgi:hypothetical protein